MISLLKDIARSLESLYTPSEAMQLAKMMVCHYGGFTPAQLFVSNFRDLSPEANHQLQTAIRRLQLNEPVQYILGEEQFFGLTFEVSPAVLIPRPETSELVELILRDHPRPAGALLDIGTGSGCIAVTLAVKGPFDGVTAWDISPEALEIARRNGDRNRAGVVFEQRDILAVETRGMEERFDVIVSNPPYVRRSEAGEMHSNVLDYEPHTALFVEDSDPLLFYRAIARFARVALKPNGTLYFEINSQLPQETLQAVEAEGFVAPQLFFDLQGRPRIVKGIQR